MTETCSQCGDEYERIRQHWAMSDCENEQAVDWESVALFSGGHDSLVMTHYCMENDITDGVLHLDTNTGIPENEEFVREVCDRYGWPLEVRSAKKTLEEFAKEYGFPLASAHSWAYRYFKEHPLSKFASDCTTDKPEFYTGVYRDESRQRMENISAERQEREGWVWVAPLMDWTDEGFEQYREKHDLPTNQVVEDIHRSGECYCGAYASRDEELIMLEAEYPEHAEWLLDLEEEVQEEIGTDEDYCWWGGSGLTDDDINQMSELKEGGECDMVLCQDCELSQNSDF